MTALNNARGRQLDDLFSALMINHHFGGIHMADYAKTHAKSELARSLARNMVRDQQSEIIDLNGWRVELGLPRHVPGDDVVV